MADAPAEQAPAPVPAPGEDCAAPDAQMADAGDVAPTGSSPAVTQEDAVETAENAADAAAAGDAAAEGEGGEGAAVPQLRRKLRCDDFRQAFLDARRGTAHRLRFVQF